MKNAISSLAVLSLALSIPNLGFCQGFPPRDQAPGGPRPASVLEATFDLDGDGELSSREISRSAVALRKLDRDRNGKLTGDELGGAALGGPPTGPPEMRRGLGGGPGQPNMLDQWMQLDRNGDGQLSANETPQRLQSLMARADRNRDGFATREELQALAGSREGNQPGPPGGPGRPSPEQFLEFARQFDADGDGKLDMQELRQLSQGNPPMRDGQRPVRP